MRTGAATPALPSSDLASPTAALFRAEELVVGFGDRPDVLRGVDLSLGVGEFVTLLGPSGCGKTTVLNIAAGLLKPRSGRALWRGAEICGVNREVGYMTQTDTLLPWRSVAANVALPLRIRKEPREKVQEKVSRLLEMLDLTHAADFKPGELSGGMRRRALLARSIIYDPDVILMDEPFAALDAQMRSEMHSELLRATEQLNQAVLFVTHDIAEAAALSDRVLIIGGGPPARVLAEFEIPFGKGRNVEELRFDREFSEVERALHAALKTARAGEQA